MGILNRITPRKARFKLRKARFKLNSFFEAPKTDNSVLTDLDSSLDKGPYDRMKESISTGLVGRSAEGARREAGNLQLRGLGNVPGVISDVARRRESALNEVLSKRSAEIDLTFAQDKVAYDKWRTELLYSAEQADLARKMRNKEMWLSAMGDIIGSVMTIGSARIGASAGGS